MVLLDTDHMTLLQYEDSPLAKRLEGRLSQLPDDQIATSIINSEEQTRGWLTVLSKARKLSDQITVYHRLVNQLDIYCGLKVLPFDEHAAVEFQRLRKLRPRLGTLDLKIAAVARVNHATLLSRNLRDFRQFPDLSVEDWAQ